MKRNSLVYSVTVLSSLTLVGCVSAGGSERATSKRLQDSLANTTLSAGARCDFPPNNGERLGTIYKYSKGKPYRRDFTWRFWDDFDAAPNRASIIVEADAALPTNNGTYENNLGGNVALDLFELSPTKVNTGAGSESTIKVKIATGGEALDQLSEVAVGEQVLPSVGMTIPIWLGNRTIDENSNYVVVTELVRATTVVYDVDREIDRFFNADGEFTKQVTASGKFKVEGEGQTSYTLSRTFPEPWTICYKFVKLEPKYSDESGLVNFEILAVEDYDDF